MGTLPPIRIVIEEVESGAIDQVFTRPFRIGRDADCEVKIQNSHVSRNHAEIDFKDHCWWVHDLESTNGVYLNGKKVMHAPVMDKDVLNFGKDGPRAECSYLSPEAAAAFARSQPKEKSGPLSMGPFRMVAFVLIALLLGGFGFFYGRRQLDKHEVIREKAGVLFSDIRTTQVAIASVYADQAGTDKLLFAQRLNELESTRKGNLEEYKGYLIQLGLYQSLDEQESQIYNVARFFNESELAMPASFIDEVKSAIYEYWLEEGEPALKEATTRAQLFNYTPYVVKTLENYGLPIEFFYLPVYISSFNTEAELPATSEHTTLGIWQLSEASGAAYGLSIASSDDELSSVSVDERLDFKASTDAAISLLHDIYREEAMASGLLTLAIYLQHEHVAVSSRVSSPEMVLAEVPAEVLSRDIWHIRQQYPHLISDRVYEQVVRIFAAAVIGQDPQLFRLDLNTPNAVDTFKSFR